MKQGDSAKRSGRYVDQESATSAISGSHNSPIALRPELVHFAWTIAGLPLRDDAQACQTREKSVCSAALGRELTGSLTLELVPLYACMINP